MSLSPFLPARSAPFVFGFILSGFMTLLVSGISIIYANGLTDTFPRIWMDAWLISWPVAFPTILFMAPTVRWLVQRFTLEAN